MNKVIILSISCMFLIIVCKCQMSTWSRPQMSDRVDSTIDNIIHDSCFYFTQERCSKERANLQIKNTINLGKYCTAEQLEWIVRNDTSYILRICAFRQLKMKSGIMAVKVYRDFIEDTTLVCVKRGDNIVEKKFGDVLICISIFDRKPYPLNNKIQDKLDSISLFSCQQSHLLENERISCSVSLKQCYYRLFRKEFLKGNVRIMPALARFQNKQDFSLIMKRLNSVH